jgi:hypothetical protein
MGSAEVTGDTVGSVLSLVVLVVVSKPVGADVPSEVIDGGAEGDVVGGIGIGANVTVTQSDGTPRQKTGTILGQSRSSTCSLGQVYLLGDKTCSGHSGGAFTGEVYSSTAGSPDTSTSTYLAARTPN